MSIRMFETVNHKQRAQELRATARNLEAAGFSIFAELNYELAEWIDPTPRDKPEPKKARRTKPVQEAQEETSQETDRKVTHGRATPPQRTPRLHMHSQGTRVTRPTPRGTQVIAHNLNGRVLRQMGTR